MKKGNKKLVLTVKKSLFDISPNAIVVLDREGVVVEVNKKVEDWTGYDRDDLLGKRLVELPFIPEELKEMAGAQFGKRLKGEIIEPYDFPIVTKEGKQSIGRVAGRVIRDGNEPLGALIMVSDVTELKMLEKRLRTMRLGIERSSDAVFITNPDGVIQYVNPAFEKLYGYTKKDWQGKTPRILKSGKQDKKFYEYFWNKLKNKEAILVNVVNKTKDGRLINIENSANPIINERDEIVGFLAIQRDITQEIGIRNKLEEKVDELERMNRVMVGREIKMTELKERIKELEGQEPDDK